jgi:hypothetical protein
MADAVSAKAGHSARWLNVGAARSSCVIHRAGGAGTGAGAAGVEAGSASAFALGAAVAPGAGLAPGAGFARGARLPLRGVPSS